MTDQTEWQDRVGRNWAREWRRTDRSFSGLTDRLLGAASARPFGAALDVGCGAGELALALARGHPVAQVVGVDVSADLVAVARTRGERLPNLSFELGDAAAWSDGDFRPDLIVSRHGVMFFPAPVAAFTHIAGIATEGARLVFSCFRDRADNPWARGVAELLPDGLAASAPADAPGPFAFADPARVEAILREAGWHEIAFEPVDYAFIAGAGNDPVANAADFFQTIGPAAAAIALLDEAERGALHARLRQFAARHRQGSIVALPAAAWIVTARTR